MDQVMKCAAIYDKLNGQPHLQDVIKGHYYSVLEAEDKKKLHQNTSKTGLPIHIFSDGYCIYDSSKYYKKKAKKNGFFKTHVKSLKKSEKLAEKTGCNPYPSYDVFMQLKVHIADCYSEAKATHRSSKNRDKFVLENFKTYVGH